MLWLHEMNRQAGVVDDQTSQVGFSQKWSRSVLSERSALERVLHSELDDPWRAGLRGDAAELSRVDIGDGPTSGLVHAGIAPVERVEQIERLEAELQRLHARNADLAGYRQIHAPEMGPHEGVPLLVAVRPGLRLGKRCAIEIVGQRPLLRIDVVADPVRSLVPLPG